MLPMPSTELRWNTARQDRSARSGSIKVNSSEVVMKTPPSLFETAVAQRVRRFNENENLENHSGLAYEIAMQEFLASDPQPVVSSRAPKPEPEVTPRKKCLVHREQTHVFTNGEIMIACTHSDCRFGSGHADDSNFRKKHSDGSQAGSYSYSEIADDMPTVEPSDDGEGVVEVSPDDPVELNIRSEPARVAGLETDDTDPYESDVDDEESVQDEVEEDVDCGMFGA
jgi:hypothetical protein